MIELPSDFIHVAPEGYSYHVEEFKKNVHAVWLNHHRQYDYNLKEPVKTIWGFIKYTKKGHKYYSPIDCKKVGKEVNIEDTRDFTAIPLNLNPLEAAFV